MTSFENAEEPLAWFVTFSCSPGWLRGDHQTSIGSWRSITPLAPSSGPEGLCDEATWRETIERPVILGGPRRQAVENAVRDACAARAWRLFALNVRANHVYAVVQANATADRVMVGLKALSTRRLRDEGFVGPHERVWTCAGSIRAIRTLGDVGGVARSGQHSEGRAHPVGLQTRQWAPAEPCARRASVVSDGQGPREECTPPVDQWDLPGGLP